MRCVRPYLEECHTTNATTTYQDESAEKCETVYEEVCSTDEDKKDCKEVCETEYKEEPV